MGIAETSDRSDARFEALAETAPDAILTIDQDSIVLFANPAVQRIFGYSREELVGRSLNVIMPERFRAAHNAGVARYLRTGRRNVAWTGLELTALTKDGREIPVEISFGEYVDDSGRHVFSGFVRDVSDRVRYERELIAARSTAEQALLELERLGRIVDTAIGRATYDEMLEELLRRLRQELGADEATVLFADSASHDLVVRASDGLYERSELGRRVPIGVGMAGTVAKTGTPRLIEDLRDVEVHSPILRERMTSVAAVPIRSDNVVIGVLHVGSRTPRRFSTNDLRVLGVVAERMAGVMARSRLFESERQARELAEAARREVAAREDELRRLNAELELRAREERALRTLAQSITGAVRIHEVMHQIAEGALSVSNATGAYVEQVISRDGEVEVVATAGEQVPPIGQHVPFPGSLTEEIIKQREPVFLIRMEGLGAAMAPYLAQECHDCSVLVVPLMAHADAIGALVLLRKAEEPPFSPDVVTRVRTLADLASIALQRLVAMAESERRRAEAEAAVRSRDEVLSVVSHDLRNPVSTVAMSASLLADSEIALSDDQRRSTIGVIARSAQRMNRLIQDLLDVARIEGGRLTISCKCEDGGTLASEAFESFRSIAEQKEIALTCDVEPELPHVLVDRDRVLQVLSNYLNNAMKFTPKGGRVAIRAVAKDGGVEYAVSDTGPGIAPADLQQVFARFWQAKRTAHLGSGLGLAISKGIAEAHRGSVRVESVVGEGSTFYLTIPFAKECV